MVFVNGWLFVLTKETFLAELKGTALLMLSSSLFTSLIDLTPISNEVAPDQTTCQGGSGILQINSNRLN